MSELSLGDCLKAVCRERPDYDIINTYCAKHNDSYHKINHNLLNKLKELLGTKRYKFRCYKGHNSLYRESVVWVGFKDNREFNPVSFQTGVYIAYFFSLDKKNFYLTLNQGVYKNNYIDEIKSKVKKISPIPDGFYDKEQIDLKTTNNLGQEYAYATIYWKKYNVEDMPSEEVLLTDLNNLIESYDKYEGSKKNILLRNEP